MGVDYMKICQSMDQCELHSLIWLSLLISLLFQSILLISHCFQVTWFLQIPLWYLTSICWICGTRPTWSSPKPSLLPRTASARWCALTLCATILTGPCSTALSLILGELRLGWVMGFGDIWIIYIHISLILRLTFNQVATNIYSYLLNDLNKCWPFYETI